MTTLNNLWHKIGLLFVLSFQVLILLFKDISSQALIKPLVTSLNF